MNKRMNTILCIVAVMVTACVGATVQPTAPETSAFGDPVENSNKSFDLNLGNKIAQAQECGSIAGAIWCNDSSLCCPSLWPYCPPSGAVYPANQVCSKHRQ